MLRKFIELVVLPFIAGIMTRVTFDDGHYLLSCAFGVIFIIHLALIPLKLRRNFKEENK